MTVERAVAVALEGVGAGGYRVSRVEALREVARVLYAHCGGAGALERAEALALTTTERRFVVNKVRESVERFGEGP